MTGCLSKNNEFRGNHKSSSTHLCLKQTLWQPNKELKMSMGKCIIIYYQKHPPTPYKGHVWCFQDTIITPFLKPLKYSYNTCFTFNVLKKLIHFISSFKNGTIRPTSFFRFVIVMDATIYLLHSIFSSIFSFA